MIPVFAHTVVQLGLAALAGKVPDPNDVVPGAVSVFVFIFLALAVVFLLFSFRKQLRKVDGHFGVNSDGKGSEPNGSDQRG